MGNTELVALFEKLPPKRQAEVFDFTEFLATYCCDDTEAVVLPSQSLAELLAHPLKVRQGFTVMKRDELYDRACLC